MNVVYRSANHDGGCSRTGIILLPALRNPMDMPCAPTIVRFLIFSHYGFYRAVSVRHADFPGVCLLEICFIWVPLVTPACGGPPTIISSPFRSDHAIRSIGQYAKAVSIFCRSAGCTAPIANNVPLLRNGSIHTSNAAVCGLS